MSLSNYTPYAKNICTRVRDGEQWEEWDDVKLDELVAYLISRGYTVKEKGNGIP